MRHASTQAWSALMVYNYYWCSCATQSVLACHQTIHSLIWNMFESHVTTGLAESVSSLICIAYNSKLSKTLEDEPYDYNLNRLVWSKRSLKHTSHCESQGWTGRCAVSKQNLVGSNGLLKWAFLRWLPPCPFSDCIRVLLPQHCHHYLGVTSLWYTLSVWWPNSNGDIYQRGKGDLLELSVASRNCFLSDAQESTPNKHKILQPRWKYISFEGWFIW